MASNNPVLYDDWYCELNVYFKTTDVRRSQPEDVQIYNLNKMCSYFLQEGWTRNSIAGMLGNIMTESTVNPWLFQDRTLDWDHPTQIILNMGGMGLTQWTPCAKYYNWAVNSNLDPKSGETMCDRIMYEYQNNLQWSLDNYGNHTWEDFVTSTEEPYILADVWCWAYERPASPDMQQRWANAEWCFANIYGTPRLRRAVLFNQFNKRKELKRKWQRM